jgi:hypothetical protein
LGRAREREGWLEPGSKDGKSQKVQRRQEVRACTEQQSMDPSMVLPLSIWPYPQPTLQLWLTAIVHIRLDQQVWPEDLILTNLPGQQSWSCNHNNVQTSYWMHVIDDGVKLILSFP